MSLIIMRKNPKPKVVRLSAKLNQTQADKLKAAGHVVAIYPRKKLVVVDGFKRYSFVSNPVKKPVAKRKTVSKKYLIEAVADRYGNLKFYYWNGREFTHSRDSAMTYNSMNGADEVRKEIKKTKLYVKLTKAIRIVPA